MFPVRARLQAVIATRQTFKNTLNKLPLQLNLSQQIRTNITVTTGSWQSPSPPKFATELNKHKDAAWHKQPLKDAQSDKYEKLYKLDDSRKVVMLGFGAIGTGVLPMLLRHIDMKPSQLIVLSKEFTDENKQHAKNYGVELIEADLRQKGDYKSVLQKYIKSDDLLINVSVDVSSVALIEHCAAVNALYIDTCNEPWAGGYSDPNLSASARSNYGIREQALELRRDGRVKPDGPTAVITHGANPGLVSHFVKQGLLNIAADVNHKIKKQPQTGAEWAELMRDLGIKSVHIAEKDTQASDQPKKLHEFVNTWSIEGFQEEGKQPVELGWGTHEPDFPHDGERHTYGSDAGIYLNRPGALTPVRTWTPMNGNFHGLCITHTEAVTITDYFTLKENDKVTYRPTVHFAYHASNDAMASMSQVAGNEWQSLDVERVNVDNIVQGNDELGVLLLGHKKNAYWFGSNLSIERARSLLPNNNATSLQVCAGVLSGAVWTLENPKRGLVEPEQMEHDKVLKVAYPYLGDVVGKYSDWTPLYRRSILFPEKLDEKNVWAFNNFRVL